MLGKKPVSSPRLVNAPSSTGGSYVRQAVRSKAISIQESDEETEGRGAVIASEHTSSKLKLSDTEIVLNTPTLGKDVLGSPTEKDEEANIINGHSSSNNRLSEQNRKRKTSSFLDELLAGKNRKKEKKRK